MIIVIADPTMSLEEVMGRVPGAKSVVLIDLRSSHDVDCGNGADADEDVYPVVENEYPRRPRSSFGFSEFSIREYSCNPFSHDFLDYVEPDPDFFKSHHWDMDRRYFRLVLNYHLEVIMKVFLFCQRAREEKRLSASAQPDLDFEIEL